MKRTLSLLLCLTALADAPAPLRITTRDKQPLILIHAAGPWRLERTFDFDTWTDYASGDAGDYCLAAERQHRAFFRLITFDQVCDREEHDRKKKG